MPTPLPRSRPAQDSAAHHALRGLAHTLFLAACGAGFWGAMIAGEYVGFRPVSTGLILLCLMLYIALVLDQGPPDPPAPLSPEGARIHGEMQERQAGEARAWWAVNSQHGSEEAGPAAVGSVTPPAPEDQRP